jgi:hypothetical protein
MTAESGADDPTVQQNQGTDLGSDEAGTPSSRRPVAKTILEGQIPQLLDDGQSGAKIDSSETSINSSPNEETSSSTDLNQTGRKVDRGNSPNRRTNRSSYRRSTHFDKVSSENQTGDVTSQCKRG